ncbi:MAG: purine-nucleoside phosphorylase [Chitinophagia bacterium]|nr:purine-nucleoside phosphorylase [Chitinophagia bacterium]
MELFDKIAQAKAFFDAQQLPAPTVGIILGSGLGGLVNIIEVVREIPYSDIPGFELSTVAGHAGKLVFGKIGDRDVVLMAGRFHYYEGYSMQTVTFPVRVMKAIGVEYLIVSNAAGATNASFHIGDIMLINDHINLFPEHPLRGRNDERLGVRFPDMGEAYDREMLEIARQQASLLGIPVQEGVYVGLQGPTFETPAEYRWLKVIGGDVVGMSTVPEVIVARHAGIKVFAMSVVTDLGITDEPVVITHEEVLAAANETAPKMAALAAAIIKALH